MLYYNSKMKLKTKKIKFKTGLKNLRRRLTMLMLIFASSLIIYMAF